MKNFILILFSILFISTPIYAQESEESSSFESGISSNNAYFDISLQRGTQSPINKAIPFTVTITPKIDSPRTQILWDVPVVFTLKTKHSEFVSLKKDETYKYSATVKPNREGIYNITVNIISWQHDTNKTNSVKDTVTISESLTVSPTDSIYVLYFVLFILGILLLIGGSIYLLFVLFSKSMSSIQKWLTPPF